MKKIFTLIAAAAVAVSAMANEYTGQLAVMINGEGGSQETTINIVKQDVPNEEGVDLYTLEIRNFMLDIGEGQVVGVGNIILTDMPAYEFNERNLIVTNQNILITEGDDPDVAFWLGPNLDEVPISMTAKFDDTEASVDIVIDMRVQLEQLIYVNFDNTSKEPVNPGIRGDLNGDGNVNTGDVSALYGIILGTAE